MKKIISFLNKIINKIPVSSKLRNIIRIIFLNYEGIGSLNTGDQSIDNEVECCLSLIKIIPRNFFDIGANEGNYTSKILKKFPNLECHIFEPSKRNYDILKNKFKSKKIFINKIGLSNLNKKSKVFSDSPGSGLTSLSKRNLSHLNINMDYQEDIKLKRFDTYWGGGERFNFRLYKN